MKTISGNLNMASILDDLKYTYSSGTMVIRFLFINVAVFLVLVMIRTIGFFYKANFIEGLLPWIAGTSDLRGMMFKPWTALSYMFVHIAFFHLFFNMILLYFAGRPFEDLLNARRFVAVYFMGGLAGFLAYLLAFNIFPVFRDSSSIIYGASASIMAILVAIATYSPNLELRLVLIGNVKLKFIAIFFVAMDVLFLDGENSGGKIAHIGGAMFGYLFSYNLQHGNDWSRPFWKVVDFFADLIRPKPKMKVASSADYARSAFVQESKTERVHSKKIDEILDKISRSGYDSLSKDEKQYLFNASRK